jgi:hypothetical protein
MRNRTILTIGVLFISCALSLAVLWLGSQPSSDEKVIALHHTNQESLTQLVQLYQEDQVGVIVRRNGSIFPAEATVQLSPDRLSL